MGQSDKELSEAERLRTPDTAHQPDSRWASFSSFRPSGEFTPVSLEDFHNALADHTLSENVPVNVRIHFETARNLYLFSWFVYRFRPISEQQALGALEMALRTRLTKTNKSGKKSLPGLKRLLDEAIADGLITNHGLRQHERLALTRARRRVSYEKSREMIEKGLDEISWDESTIKPEPQDYSHDRLDILREALTFLRNEYAHGSSSLQPTVLGTFEIVADLINQLYPNDQAQLASGSDITPNACPQSPPVQTS